MEGTNPTFKDWLLANYRGVDSPFGDLADDTARVRDFPEVNDREAIYRYLLRRNACQECLAVFNAAWAAYVRYRRRQEHA